MTMATIDQKQIAANWAKRGFSCELWTDPPGRRWEDFAHATDELIVVMEGEMDSRSLDRFVTVRSERSF